MHEGKFIILCGCCQEEVLNNLLITCIIGWIALQFPTAEAVWPTMAKMGECKATTTK